VYFLKQQAVVSLEAEVRRAGRMKSQAMETIQKRLRILSDAVRARPKASADSV
jgi:hypothetical protein